MDFGTTYYPAPGKIDIIQSLKQNNQYNCSSTRKEPITRTTQPIVTGTSVLGIKFDGGVAIAADMLGSYGSLARFPGLSRMMKVNKNTIIAASGDYADFQSIKDDLDLMMIENDIQDDGHGYTPESIFAFLRIFLYQKRSKFEPLWNTLAVAGYKHDKPFLGFVDKLGVAYEETTVATGYGAYIARPLMTKAIEDKNGSLSKDEAIKLLSDCLKVLYYRDARSINRFEIAVCTKDGISIESNMKSVTNWDIANMIPSL